jgi:hypothetical protein
MPKLKLPNGEVLNFPEQASKEQMRNYVSKNYPQYAPKAQKADDGGFVGGLKRLGGKALEGIEDVGKGLVGIGSDIVGTGAEAVRHPIDTTGKLLSGAAHGAYDDIRALQGALSKGGGYLTNPALAYAPETMRQEGPAAPPETTPRLPEWTAGQSPEDPAYRLGSMAGYLVPALGEERLAVGAARKLAPTVSRGSSIARDAAARAGLWAGLATGEDQDPEKAAMLSLISELPGGLALSKRIPLALARRTAEGERKAGSRQVRTPEQAQQILERTQDLGADGQPFPMSLGQLTRSEKLLATEDFLNKLPFLRVRDRLKGATNLVKNSSTDFLNELAGGESIQGLRPAINKELQSAHDAVEGLMADKYKAFEPEVVKSGFEIKERPNLEQTIDKHLGRDESREKKGAQLAVPELSATDINYLEKLREGPQKGEKLTYSDMRDVEKSLKQKARVTDSEEKAKVYNDVAHAIRKDFEHNAKIQGNPGLQKKLEDANSFAKTNYYDVWNKPEIHKLLRGEGGEFFNALMSPKHEKLMSQLPMSLKNKLFASKFINALSDTEGGFSLNPEAFSRISKKGGFKNIEGKEKLLTEEQRQKLDNIHLMNELTADTKVSKAKVPTGKMNLDMLALIAGLGGSVAAPKLAIPAILGSKGAAKALTDPDILKAYAEGARVPLKERKAKSPTSVAQALGQYIGTQAND